MSTAPQVDPYDFHRQRYLDPTVDKALRVASGQWLVDHGLLGLYGKEIILDVEKLI